MRKINSFLISLSLLLIGLILEYIHPLQLLPQMLFPNSLYIGIALINIILFLHFAYKQNPIVKWLASVPAAISAISLLILLSLLMGLIAQHNDAPTIHTFGLHYIKKTWYLAFSLIYIIISLGLTTIKRLYPFKKQNIGFIINHLGLWIVLFAAFLGSNDLKRTSIQLEEGKSQWQGTNRSGMSALPCPITLLDFELDEYLPQLQLLQRNSKEIIKSEIKETQDEQDITLGNYQLTLTQFMTQAHPDSACYITKEHPGSVYAAYITIKDQDQHVINKGWIATNSFMYPSKDLYIDKDTKLRLNESQAKRYASTVVFNNQDTITIEVNQPVKYGKRKYYQSSYDSNMGKWSRTSYLEMVYDPWLPLVYTGIFMLLVGSLFMLWEGNKNKIYE